MLEQLIFGKLSLDALPDDPITLYGAGSVLFLGLFLVLGSITYFKKWKYVWTEWICTVDHKKIGIMYVMLAFVMFIRALIQAMMMRAQQALSVGPGHTGYMDPAYYNQFFSEHGVIMIFFVAMPLIFGVINMVLPLQIGARDVAYPYLNSLSFWLTLVSAGFMMISLVVGNWDRAGWLAYPPLSGLKYSPDVGVDYFIWVLQISGVGSLLSGINFTVTVFKMRCPGMTLMKMPVFVWASLCAMILVALAFPILTVTLALLALDRAVDMHFFTQTQGGNIMMYINMIWAWGHPEVYILILPIFGVFSEIVATFSRKRLFGYNTMVGAILLIGFLSFIVWLHHFFTMGSGADVNAFFGIMTIIIAIPTGVKVFNWLFTMFRGNINFATPMMWIMAFFTTFAIGGMTGVMMSIPPVDFQTHNSLFLVSHFHNVIIGGVLFGFFAGLSYWFPKIFGFMLDERRGKYAFWLWVSGFYLAFMPLYPLGLMGAMRRNYHFENLAFKPYLWIAALGAALIFLGFLCQVWQLVYSIKHKESLRDKTGDPWDGRTLEWSLSSPAPFYNFAHIPVVSQIDDYWYKKQALRAEGKEPPIAADHYEDVHMPRSTPAGFLIALFAALFGFSAIWHMVIPGIFGLLGIIAVVVLKSFNLDTDYYVKASEVEAIEKAFIKEAHS
ncbi:MAG: cytochrome o ubiquinol oxidase subunit I [Coxiellaceae bacterium]|nr:cytochrome o ubiquinol oxidase subunit I [Coxiellaceae bacterium]